MAPMIMSVTNNIKNVKTTAEEVSLIADINELKLNENKTIPDQDQAAGDLFKGVNLLKVENVNGNIYVGGSACMPSNNDSDSYEIVLRSPKSSSPEISNSLRNQSTSTTESESQSSKPTLKEEIQKKTISIRNRLEQNNLDSAFRASKSLLRLLNNSDVRESLADEYEESDKVVKGTIGITSNKNTKLKAKKCIKLMKLRINFVAKVFSSKTKAEKLLDCARLLWEIVRNVSFFWAEICNLMDKILQKFQNTDNFDSKFSALSSFHYIYGEIMRFIRDKGKAEEEFTKANNTLENDHNSRQEKIETLYCLLETKLDLFIKLGHPKKAKKMLKEFLCLLEKNEENLEENFYHNLTNTVNERMKSLEKQGIFCITIKGFFFRVKINVLRKVKHWRSKYL